VNRSTRYARRAAGPALALAAAGLVLAGCGSSPGSGSGSSGSPGSSQPSGGSASKSAAGSGSASTSATGSTGSTTGYANWPIGVGNTWLYQNSLGGTVTNKMTAVVPVSGGQQVTQSDTIDLAGSPTTTDGTYIFHSDGSITYPADAFGNGVSIQGGIGLPSTAALASGQASKSVLQVTVNQDGQHFSETAHVTVNGAGTASVTVPAGTYQATIVDMTMVMTVATIPVSIEVRTWLANGVGPVQSEVITIEAGAQHVTDEQKLESFTKG
jgi:hypothetical protein